MNAVVEGFSFASFAVSRKVSHSYPTRRRPITSSVRRMRLTTATILRVSPFLERFMNAGTMRQTGGESNDLRDRAIPVCCSPVHIERVSRGETCYDENREISVRRRSDGAR